LVKKSFVIAECIFADKKQTNFICGTNFAFYERIPLKTV